MTSPTDWDAFTTIPGKIDGGATAGIAADHYHRLDDDLDLLSRLGVCTYRFSISWSRVQPDGGSRVNPPGLAFYERLVDGLLERGITPMVTINHMELPLPLAESGGWLRDTADRYVDYAATVHPGWATGSTCNRR